eukprot:6362861-Ditylum_brightwellii.AAC.1
MSKVTSEIKSNQKSIKKIESNLNDVSLTISKVKHKLKKEEKVYRRQHQDINQCITDISTYADNNKEITSQFEDKLNKAILDSKQAFNICNVMSITSVMSVTSVTPVTSRHARHVTSRDI